MRKPPEALSLPKSLNSDGRRNIGQPAGLGKI